MQRQIPGDPNKIASDELPLIRRFLRTECCAGMMITRVVITQLCDLVEEQADAAIAQLVREGMLVRCAELGGIAVVPPELPPEE